MKRLHAILPALAICLMAVLMVWRSEEGPEGGSKSEGKALAQSKPVRGLADEAPMGFRPPPVASKARDPLADLADVKLPLSEDLRWQEPVQEAVFEDFRRWTEEQSAARAGEGLQRGIQLAQQRRHELLRLIEKNPQRALEFAVPHGVRQQLPQEIVELLEQPIDAFGDMSVMATTLEGERGCQIDRKVTLQDGQVFDAFTYGRRSAMPTRDFIAIHGIALDGKLALSEFTGRVLEPSEIAARLEAGQSIGESQEQTDALDGPVIAFGSGKMIRYPDETQAVAALLLAEGEEQSGATAALASDLDGVIAYSPKTEGQKTLLIIRVDFPDYQGGSATDSELQTLIADMNSVYKDMSSDKASFALDGQGSAITPVLRLPNNVSYYTTNSFSRILTAARTAAAAAGYNYTNYTYEVVVTGAQPAMAGTAGVAFVGGRGAWLHNKQWNLKTCAHEVGHNFGLPHSGAWNTNDGSVIGSGSVSDYGNVFDIMGVGPSPHTSRHFSANHKEYLDWILTSDLVKITTNGTTTTRIRAMDKNQPDGNKRALVVDRAGSTDDYWIEHRQLYGTSYDMRDGVLVNWANINGGYQQPLLLDMRPDTSDKKDAILPIGKTFSDTAAGIHITPVGRGTDADGVNWVDVTVNRGTVTGNASPTASISASNANPAINGSVTFTCTASDPNGDTLAYFWDWGNDTTTATNSATASKSWPTAGTYVVQCTVSDMKGLTTTADYVIQVGGTGFFIEGMVRTLQGIPLQGIVVTASPTALKGTTDATGRYIITGLSAGTYTLTASSGAPDGFSNPVTVGPSLQDRNFLRSSYPFTWDANTGTGGAQDGGGTWASGAGNWFNQTTSVNAQWGNANLDSATFGAGADGTYAVTLSGTVQAGGGLSFLNSGYALSGGALWLHDGANNVSVSVAAGKTATINSAITYQNNQRATLTADAGATLNLSGGASNSQYRFQGGGTINMTAGTYSANVGTVNTGTFNQSGGTFNMNLPSGNDGHYIGFAAGRSVSYTMSGSAIINANASGTANTNSFLAIGRGAGNTAYSNTLNVTGAANLNIGNAAGMAGELLIAYDNVSNGTLNVTGGAATVGTGKTDNKIYFFKAGSGFGYTANLTQSGGTVTANGIQFGGTSGAYDATSTANLTLSGGVLYVGAQGITRGSAADDLPVAIKLQGGTLGANQNWSSSLDMQLGATAGGVTIRAQDAANTARNITLTGNLSDDGDVGGTLIKVGSGTLTLQGNNSFSGGLTIQNGSVVAKTNATALGTGPVVMGGAGSSGASLLVGNTYSNPITINAPTSGSVVIGADGIGSGYTLSGIITLNSDLILRTFDNTISGSIKAASGIMGGVTGTGNVLLDNLGLAANFFNITTNPINHTGSLALQGTATGNTNIGAAIGANVTSVTQNSATSTLVLSGSNAYSGATTISAGTLRLGGANAIPDGVGKGNVAVTGTFDLNGFSETINGLSGAGTVDNTAASTPAILTVSVGSVFNGTLKNSGANLALVKAGNTDFTLAGNNTYSGETTINAGRLFIANPGSLTPNGVVQINNGGGLHLNANGTPTYNQSITIASGGKLSMRKAATLSNLSLPSAGSVIFNNDDQPTVGFALNKNLSLTGDLSVQVGGSSGSPGDVTLSGTISGSGGLNKTQVGTLMLSGANTYSGATTISAGTLRLGGANAIPDGVGKGNVAVTGTFDLNGFSETINGLSGAGTVDNTAASTPSTLTVSADSNFSGILKNSGASLALVKTGEADFVMSGSNSYSGGTTINAGRIFISSTSALTANGAVQINNGASFILNTTGTYAQSITLNSGANLAQRQAATLSNVTLPSSGSVIFNNDDVATQAFTLASPQTLGGSLNVQVGGGAGAPGTITLSGILSGAGGSLVKSGTGTLVLSGSSSFGGGFSIKNGTVEAKTTNTPMGTGTVTMGGTGSTGTTLITGRALSNAFVINAPDSGSVVIGANGNGSAYTLSGGITLNGNLTLQTYNNPADAVIKASGIISGGITGTGNVVLNNNGLSANVFNITTAAVNHTGSITLQGTGTGDTTISSSIGANVTGITQNSATSTLVLSGSNAYSGATTISAGTLRLGGANAIPDGVGKGNVAVTGTFDLNGFSETINGLSGAGTVDNTAASTPATLTVSADSNFSGILKNSGASLALVKTGEADFVMSGSNSYSGGTTINAGRIFISSTSALTANGVVQINNGGGLHLNANGAPTYGQSITLASGGKLAMRQAATLTNVTLPSSGSVIFNSDEQNTVGFTLNSNVALTGGLTVQVGGAAGSPGDVTMSGAISGTSGLTKTQTGTLILTGNKTYSGATMVSAGTLALSSGSTASPITVASNAKLGFTLGSTYTSAAALTLSAGHSISITGTPTLESYTLFTTSGAITGTPQLTSAIPDYELQVVGGNELRLVSTSVDPFAEWSGGATFDADANGDGVSNGMAFLLGAANPNVSALSLLPSVSRSGSNLVLNFSMRNAANRGTATLSVQHSGDLDLADPWATVLVPDASGGPTSGVTFTVTEGDPLNSVSAAISSSEAVGGKLFGRLIATP